MKKISAITFTAILFVMMSKFVIAQTPLKISNKPSSKIPICKVGNSKFDIKNSDDQAACDQLKKPSPKGNANPPPQTIGSPNPISNPPTGN
jgi:hypothetical protein